MFLGLRTHYEKQDAFVGLFKWVFDEVGFFRIVDSASD